jgi:glycosyltransferase involved in cell wall biosynthesis
MNEQWISANGTAQLVSVIIPTFNRSALLKEAVKSVYEQNYRPIECIIVDDGSTDDTAETVKELQVMRGPDFQLHYILQSNAGAQVARNNGTLHSTGAFIQYLDSDDLLYEGKLKSQVSYFHAHRDCDGVFGDWCRGTAEQYEFIRGFAKDDLIDQFLTDRCIANFSFLMRRSLIAAIGPWDIAIKRNQEIDYHLRGLILHGQYHYLSGITGLWREHSGERIFTRTKFAHVIAFYRKWEQVLQQHNRWTGGLQKGIVNNYLGVYRQSETTEMVQLLREMHRLDPLHPIFSSIKFKAASKLLGFSKAASLWVNRYQQHH